MTTIRAVLVGINEYERPDIPSLRGCVNDVFLVRKLLRRWFGVDNRHIRVIVDARATKAEILRRLRESLGAAEAGDLVVFYFSGHGSQIRDRDGDELADELDELLCPYDMDWDAGRYIVDDEFDAIVASAPPDVLIEAFFDCCFWGAEPPEFAPAAGAPRAGPGLRYAMPPPDIYARAEGEPLTVSPLAAGLRIDEGNVAWSASEEGMTASEFEVDGAYYGLFTFWGCQSIRDYVARGELRYSSRERLIHDVRAILAALPSGQRPGVFAPRELLYEPPLTPMAPRPVIR
jgi:hypothetical protein